MGAALQVFEFEGQSLRVYVFRGRPCWIAQDVGLAIGYTVKGFQAALSEWSEELIAGQDLSTLRGHDLREFKRICKPTVGSTVAHLSILYESGIDLVCLKTEKPLGKRLRRFMADKVMPALRRGTLDPSKSALELSRHPDKFFSKLTHVYQRTPLQLGW